MKFPKDIFYGIKDERIIEAMELLPRELFLPERLHDSAYVDGALPIGMGQTISQPSLVAYMTGLLDLTGEERVLEIGTGSGYQTALLAKLAHRVYTVEIVEELHNRAKDALEQLDINNVTYKLGNGYQGWKEHAPYDRIMVTAAPASIPMKLIEQLKTKGVMVAPIGGEHEVQRLKRITKTVDGFTEEDMNYVRFVPMVDR